jgi:catechol 2,3-dioxygenase-like lactoylglutathione lyase family enzyme
MTRQLLHWVFKVGNLRSNLDFYENILGMRVLRHEEFSTGCDAKCNGDYARPWSKTMYPPMVVFVFT